MMRTMRMEMRTGERTEGTAAMQQKRKRWIDRAKGWIVREHSPASVLHRC